MQIGLDSYSYHRLLGEIRPGERDPGRRFPNGGEAVVGEARALGLDVVSLQTCFLGRPPEPLRDVELVLAWGHPDGLHGGTSEAALADLLAWIDAAPAAGCRVVRAVAGPRGGRPRLEQAAAALRVACDRARERGVELAVENHVDLTAVQLAELLELVGDETLGVCFDTANALRVGDDPFEAARLLEPSVRLVHLKDCESAEGREGVPGPASVPFGEGVIPLQEIVEVLGGRPLLVELGHLGPGEVDEVRLVRDCVAWLRALDRAGAPR